MHTNEEPARSQAACRNGFFRRGTGAFETWNRHGRRCSPRCSRLRLGGLCKWHTRGIKGRRRDSAVLWPPLRASKPNGVSSWLLSGPGAGHLVSSQDPPVCPPAHPTPRKNPRQNGDHTAGSIFPCGSAAKYRRKEGSIVAHDTLPAVPVPSPCPLTRQFKRLRLVYCELSAV